MIKGSLSETFGGKQALLLQGPDGRSSAAHGSAAHGGQSSGLPCQLSKLPGLHVFKEGVMSDKGKDKFKHIHGLGKCTWGKVAVSNPRSHAQFFILWNEYDLCGPLCPCRLVHTACVPHSPAGSAHSSFQIFMKREGTIRVGAACCEVQERVKMLNFE